MKKIFSFVFVSFSTTSLPVQKLPDFLSRVEEKVEIFMIKFRKNLDLCVVKDRGGKNLIFFVFSPITHDTHTISKKEILADFWWQAEEKMENFINKFRKILGNCVMSSVSR